MDIVTKNGGGGRPKHSANTLLAEYTLARIHLIAVLKLYLVALALMETGRVKKRQVKPVRKEAGGQGRLPKAAALPPKDL
jgi:hypothetical protein